MRVVPLLARPLVHLDLFSALLIFRGRSLQSGLRVWVLDAICKALRSLRQLAKLDGIGFHLMSYQRRSPLISRFATRAGV